MFIWKRCGTANELTQRSFSRTGKATSDKPALMCALNLSAALSFVFAMVVLSVPAARSDDLKLFTGVVPQWAQCIVPYKIDEQMPSALAMLKPEPGFQDDTCEGGPNSSPICAYKTMAACDTWQDRDWCIAVDGVISPPKPEPEGNEAASQPKPKMAKPTEPWKRPLTSPEMTGVFGRVLGARTVTRDRCQLEPTDHVADSAIGHYALLDTVEIMTLDCSKPSVRCTRTSYFMKKDAAEWVFHEWNFPQPESCFSENDPSDEDPYCKRQAFVMPWALRSEYDERLKAAPIGWANLLRSLWQAATP